MTIIGSPARDDELADQTEPEPEPAPDEPELPPAAEAEVDGLASESRGWWRRRRDGNDEAGSEQEPPRHVRVLPAADELPRADPWEEGFDAPGATDESGEPGEPALVEDEAPRGFRRR
jgi:hypothetical protein